MKTLTCNPRVLTKLNRSVLLVLLLAQVACQAATEPPAEPSERVAPEVRETETEVAPLGDEPAPLDAVATTDTFYAWYLDYNDPEQGRNALVDGAYGQSPYLSAGLIEAVDAQLAQMREEYGGAGYDPFLMAQALPQGFTVEPWESGADEACVIVHQQFGESVHDLTVDLVLEEGAWKIDHIREGSPMTPEGVTKLFLNDYLAQARAGVESGEPGLLQSGAYGDSAWLNPDFVVQVDDLVAGFERGGYDPFLCAQDLPGWVNVDGVIITTSGARVAVRSSFPNHVYVVELAQDAGGGWHIADIVCPGAPQGNAAIFYTWYLAYSRNCCVLGATDPRMQRSPLVDGAYKRAPYINPAFAAEVEAELQAMHAGGGSGYDPILQAQAFPPDFTVEAGVQEGIVIVDMAFANEHRLEVRMAQVEGQWLVSGVTLLEDETPPTPAAAGPDTTTWIAIGDAQNGFSFHIPPDWVAEEQPLGGPGTPDDWPVRRQYLVMPATLAQQMASRSGPPSGDEMPLVPPFVVSYLVGDRQAFDRVFVSAQDVVDLTMGPNTVQAQRQGGDYAMPRYVFHDENDPQRWVIVEDMVNEFPGREVQAAEVFGVLDGILMTMLLDR